MKTLNIRFPAPRSAELYEGNIAEPGPNQILVRTVSSLISTGTEGLCYRADFDPDCYWPKGDCFPMSPGYSNVGQVVQVGSEVERFQEGDRVFTTANHRQFALVDAGHPKSAKIPDGVADDDATWSWLTVVTQTGVRRAEQAMGETAVVIGLGPLGQLTVQYLRLIGLSEIIAIDPVASRCECARLHGATATFCGDAADAVELVESHTQGIRADVVYDVTGHDSVCALAQRLARKLGSVVLIGDAPHPSRQHLTHDVVRNQLRIIGTQNDFLPPSQAHWCAARQIPLFYQFLERGQMQVSDLVSHRFSPAQADEAYALLEERRNETLGVIFDWTLLG